MQHDGSIVTTISYAKESSKKTKASDWQHDKLYCGTIMQVYDTISMLKEQRVLRKTDQIIFFTSSGLSCLVLQFVLVNL